MQNYQPDVEQALSSLIAQGLVPGTFPASDELENRYKGAVTARAAYIINLKNRDVGLVKKDTGNNYHGVSTDLLRGSSAADFVDCMTSVTDGPEGQKVMHLKTQWIQQSGTLPASAAWVQPTKELAQIGEEPVPGPGPGPEPGPGPQPPAVDYNPRFDALEQQIAALSKQLETLRLEGSGSMKILGQTVNMGIKLNAVKP